MFYKAVLLVLEGKPEKKEKHLPMLTEKELKVFIDMRIDQLWEEGAKADIDLKPALRDYYNRHMIDANAPRHTFGQGECTYCGHCKPCPVKIDIAMVNKYYDLAVMQPDVPAAVKEHYLALEYRADACIGCHSCESRCPFGVKIAERMEKTAELFQ